MACPDRNEVALKETPYYIIERIFSVGFEPSIWEWLKAKYLWLPLGTLSRQVQLGSRSQRLIDYSYQKTDKV